MSKQPERVPWAWEPLGPEELEYRDGVDDSAPAGFIPGTSAALTAFWTVHDPADRAKPVAGMSHVYGAVRNPDGSLRVERCFDVIARDVLRTKPNAAIRHLLVYEEALTPDQCRQVCRYLEALSRDEFDWNGREIGSQWDNWIEQVGREVRGG